MGSKGVHYVDQLRNGQGLDIYRDGTHVVRVDNAGTVHVYYGHVLIHSGNVLVYKGNAEVKGNVHVTGNLDVKGDLYVQGSISTKNDCTVGGTLEIGGNIILHGSIVQNVEGAPPILHDPSPPLPPPMSPITGFPDLEDKP
ncbi:MAG: hypothetical protein PHI24_10980 [Desulfitobacteriaceae bacterium]|nr:hypothetical protein [Desulfitobacteriaceae bacterium]